MKKEDLIAGETILVGKNGNGYKRLYLGNSGLVHFVSYESKTGGYCSVGDNPYRIEELEEYYTIEQPKSKVVPLEKKVYDFVPVRVRDYDGNDWEEEKFRLVAVASNDNTDYPFIVIEEGNECSQWRQCEFI